MTSRILGWSVLVLLALPLPAPATPEEIDALVQTVRDEALRDANHDEERVERFLAERESQRRLLEEAQSELEASNRHADELRQQYEANEQKLSGFELELRERAGDLNELFAVVRQTALNADGVLGTSLVAAETPERSTFLADLGRSEQPPSIEDIRRLWSVVLTEISESGKVVRFNATVIQPHGAEASQEVTRAGVFTAVSNGAFLRYLPESGKLVELHRQPPARFQRLAHTLETAEQGMQPMALDPSQGAILSLVVQSPDLVERLRQGGAIGYAILVLGAVGLLIVLERALGLLVARRKIESQAKSSEVNTGNALGRLMNIAAERARSSVDAIATRLDEQLALESSALHRGLATLAMLAAISPLLGLLGTVTGMIETFQSITLFGTGDPKLMSGGISQALVTTELGLGVAIPLVLLHSLLSGRANRLVERLGKYSADLLTRNELD